MNCLKRTVYCIIIRHSVVVATGRNQCYPPPVRMPGTDEDVEVPKCARKDITESEEGYTGVGCNSVHAEIDAISKIPSHIGAPMSAVIIGHDFACEDCKKALLARGVVAITVVNP